MQENLDNTKCPECGKMHRGNTYSRHIPEVVDLDLGYCFTCAFWRQKIREQAANKEPNRCIVKGEMYYPYPGTDHKGDLGFGGAIFRFQQGDKLIVSNNTWHEGTIPEHFRKDLPDNAIRLSILGGPL